MKSYTRKQMLTAKAKLKGARQETNWLRKQVQSATKSYQEEILRYRIDLRFCGKNLIKSNDLLKEANRRKWYQFKEVK